MDRVEKDAFAHALGQTMQFYGKTLEKSDFSFWYSAMGDRGIASIKKALLDYVKVGKYAPRPANILELIGTNREQVVPSLPAPVTTNCPPEIAAAWMWFINRMAQGTAMAGLFAEAGPVSVETQERYLHIVNHEAKRTNQSEAIPDEFKLAEVWA